MTVRSCGARRVAHQFFDSEESFGEGAGGAVWAPRALDALDVERGHSLAIWPDRPQNIHRLFSKRRRRSSWVKRPSLPSFEPRPPEDEVGDFPLA